MMWQFKGPVHIQEEEEPIEGWGVGFRWICFGPGSCKKDSRRRVRKGPWQMLRRWAETAGTDHYKANHR